MRTAYIAGNWKMFKTVAEAEELARQLVRSLDSEAKKLMIAPPFTALTAGILKPNEVFCTINNFIKAKR